MYENWGETFPIKIFYSDNVPPTSILITQMRTHLNLETRQLFMYVTLLNNLRVNIYIEGTYQFKITQLLVCCMSMLSLRYMSVLHFYCSNKMNWYLVNRKNYQVRYICSYDLFLKGTVARDFFMNLLFMGPRFRD